MKGRLEWVCYWVYMDVCVYIISCVLRYVCRHKQNTGDPHIYICMFMYLLSFTFVTLVTCTLLPLPHPFTPQLHFHTPDHDRRPGHCSASVACTTTSLFTLASWIAPRARWPHAFTTQLNPYHALAAGIVVPAEICSAFISMHEEKEKEREIVPTASSAPDLYFPCFTGELYETDSNFGGECHHRGSWHDAYNQCTAKCAVKLGRKLKIGSSLLHSFSTCVCVCVCVRAYAYAHIYI